jgi:O-antigen/teichoic acid export membrane protein
VIPRFRLLSASTEIDARYRRGVFWNVAATALTQGATFVGNVLLAHILGRLAFGEYGMIQSTLLALASIGQLATGVAATRYVAEFRDVDKIRTGRALGLCFMATLCTGVVGCALLAFGSRYIAEDLLGAAHLAEPLIVGCGFVLFSVMNGYQVGALAGLEAYRSIGIVSGLHGIVHVTMAAVFAFGWGLNGAALAGTLSGIVRWLLYQRVLRFEAGRAEVPIRYDGLRTEGRLLWRFALPAALSGFSSMPALWLANTFLVRAPQGYAEMAIYSACVSLKGLVMLAPGLLNSVGVSLLSNLWGLGRSESYKSIFQMNVAATAFTSVIGALFLAGTGIWLLGLFGGEFVAGYGVLLILAAACILEAIAVALYQAVYSQERMWLSLFVVTLPRDLMIVVLAFFLTGKFGAIGLALANAVSWAFALTAIAILVRSAGLSSKFEAA